MDGSPNNFQSALDQRAILHEGVDRHELDRCDAKVAQISNRFASASAAKVLRFIGRMSGRPTVNPRRCAS